MQIDAATTENSMDSSQKIKNGTVLWASNSTSGNLSKESKNTDSKEYILPYVHYSVIYSNQDMEAAKVSKCPSRDECIKQLWDIYTMEYYLAIKKNKILPFATE